MLRWTNTDPKRKDTIRRPRNLRIAKVISYILIAVCQIDSEKLTCKEMRVRQVKLDFVATVTKSGYDFNK